MSTTNILGGGWCFLVISRVPARADIAHMDESGHFATAQGGFSGGALAVIPQRRELTKTLLSVVPGNSAVEAQQKVFCEIYDELKTMAAAVLRRERPGHTLQPTDLVHEAYLRLIDHERVPWRGRAYFFGAAARAMRQILVDHARRKNAAKRVAGRQRVTLTDELVAQSDSTIEILALDDLLTRLSEVDARMSQVVELRIFGGLSIRELAQVLGVSARTVEGDWAMAKKWMRRELSAP